MELTQQQIREDNTPTMSIKAWIDRYHPGLSNQAVDYAMKNNKIDYVKYGRFRNVALTVTTADYVPRADAKLSRT
jgi:hypothetical protein